MLGEITARVEGFDPDAPRALLAWRRLGEDFVVMARGRSREDGSLEFRDLVLPESGLEIVVTGVGELPDAATASRAAFAPSRPLYPPRAEVLSASDDGITLRVTPAEASGEVLLAAESGEIFARHALPAHPSSAGRVLDLRLALPAGDSFVWLAHENPDGRRSAWQSVALEEKP